MKKARNFKSAQSKWLRRNTYLHAYGRHVFGWKMQDLNPVGVVGDAKSATAEKGEALLAHSVTGLTQLLKEVDRFKMSDLENDPKI